MKVWGVILGYMLSKLYRRGTSYESYGFVVFTMKEWLLDSELFKS
jgi:preprotein translocase subunit Sec63